MKKKLFIVSILIFVIALLLTISYSINNKMLKGSINIKQIEMLKDISDSKNFSTLGNYIFLMSPSPGNDKDDTWYDNPSFLVITDPEFKILEAINLHGYYEELNLEQDKLYAFTRDESVNDYAKDINNPLVEVSTYSNGIYSDFKAVNNHVKLPKQPDVGLSPNQITITDQNQVLTLKDPTFTYKDHEYFIVDFVQNTNSTLNQTNN